MISNTTLEKAIKFANDKHTGQKRKGNGAPYILHPIRVMGIVMSVKETNNVNLLMAVCILHDVVEDCNVPVKEIAKRFGHYVAGIVDELTTDKAECEKIGKEAYLKGKMLKMSSYALRIKLADRLDNLRDMPTMDKAFKAKYSLQTKAIIDELKTGRALTKTHKKLIKKIRKVVKEYL